MKNTFKLGDELIPSVVQGVVFPILTVKEIKEASYVCDLAYIGFSPYGHFSKSLIEGEVELPFANESVVQLFSTQAEILTETKEE